MTRLIVLSRIAIVLSLLLGVAGTSQAQKKYAFSPVGFVSLRTNDGAPKSQQITIFNTSSEQLSLALDFIGDTFFTITPEPSSPTELCAGCSTNFTVTYRAVTSEPEPAWFTINDGINLGDTIRILGQDTGSLPNQTWNFMGSYRHAGRYYREPDRADILIYNRQDTDIVVTASIRPGSYGFVVAGSAQKTIKPNNIGQFSFTFLSASYDSALAVLEFTDGHHGDTISIWGRDMEPWPLGDTLRWSGPIDFGGQLPATITCRPVTFYNLTGSTATIDTIVSQWNPDNYRLEDLPSFPAVLAPYDSLTFSVCFAAPNDQGIFISGMLRVPHELPAGTSRESMFIMDGRSRQCMEVTPHPDAFRRIPRGTTDTLTYHVVNYTTEPIEVDTVTITTYGSGFAYLSADAFTIPAMDSVPIEMSFTALEADSIHYAYVTFVSTDCPVYPNAFIKGQGFDPPVEPTIYELFADSTQTIVFMDDPSQREVLWFVNDHSDTVRILSVSLKVGEHLQIFGVSPVDPEFLLPNDSLMAVVLDFVGPPGAYDDTLLIVTENAVVAMSFGMQITSESVAVNAVAQPAPSMHLSPNPSKGRVHIALKHVRSRRVEILDVLGNVVSYVEGDIWDPGA
ncbi:MAG TPA: hypothetical protein VFH43_02010, partial [Candidatus Kapabacteria bacterium]|nr:hypothetical protein [Candidatus Kapabacteria bacterium]